MGTRSHDHNGDAVSRIAWTALGAGGTALALSALSALHPAAAPAPAPSPQASAPAAEADPLAFDDAAIAKAGITLTPVTAGTESAVASGFARGLDIGGLAAIDAEIITARATAAASQAQAARLASLYAQDVSASRQSVEAARAQAVADAARTDLALRRVGLEYGPGLMRLGRGGVSTLVRAIANGDAALVRIDIPGIVLHPGSTVSIGESDSTTMVRVLGPAAVADAKLQSAGVLAIVRGPLAGQSLAGRVLTARAPSARPETGLIVPRDSIVRWQGGLWVYRRTEKGFERVELRDARPVASGWFVPAGLSAGDRIASSGAGNLLAIERGSDTE